MGTPVKTVAEMIDYLCDVLLIEHQDGTLPDEIYIELQQLTKRRKLRGDTGTLTKEQLNMPWDQFVEDLERRGTTQ